MSKNRVLIFTPLWTPGQPNEATAKMTDAIARLLAERDDLQPIVFTKASISRPWQRFRQGRVLYLVVNQRCQTRLIKLIGWLVTRVYSPYLVFFLNRHALTLLPSYTIARLANVAVAYIGERTLSTQEVQLLKLMQQTYIEDPALQALLPHAIVQPMGTDLRPFTFAVPPPPPPWRICFASSPLPWHEPEDVEMKYLRSRGVLDTLRLLEALQRHIPVHLTLVWRKNPHLINRLTANLPFVTIKTGVISDMNAFLDEFHLYSALFRPGEEQFYKPLPNSVIEAMAKGILPLAYPGTLIGEQIGSVSPDLLLSPFQDPADQAETVARRLPSLFAPEIRSALRQKALRLDLSCFLAHLLEKS